MCAQSLSRVLFVISWTAAGQAPLSMGLSKQEYWSRFPFPSPGDLPDPGIEPISPVFLAWAGGFLTTSTTWTTAINALAQILFTGSVSSLQVLCALFLKACICDLPAGVSWTVCFSFLAAFSLIFLMLLLLCYSLSLNCFFLTFSRKMSLR